MCARKAYKRGPRESPLESLWWSVISPARVCSTDSVRQNQRSPNVFAKHRSDSGNFCRIILSQRIKFSEFLTLSFNKTQNDSKCSKVIQMIWIEALLRRLESNARPKLKKPLSHREALHAKVSRWTSSAGMQNLLGRL